MKMKVIFPLLCGVALSLGGCVNLGLDGGGKDAPDIVYYVLEDAGRSSTTDNAQVSKPLVIVLRDTEAGAFYDTDGIAFSKAPGTRGYYQFARWAERSSKRFSDLLLARLEKEKTFSAVALSGMNVRGDWLLSSEIVEFYHDASQQPGQVRMEVRAEVVDMNTRKLVSRKIFSQSVDAASYDAAGAHKAFNQAATRILGEIADWLKGL